MTALSVNINKVALIRNSRKGENPNLIEYASACINAGADGITVFLGALLTIIIPKLKGRRRFSEWG